MAVFVKIRRHRYDVHDDIRKEKMVDETMKFLLTWVYTNPFDEQIKKEEARDDRLNMMA